MSPSSRYRRLGGRLAVAALVVLAWGLWVFVSRPWADTAPPPPAPATFTGPVVAVTPDPGWQCPPDTYMLDGVCRVAPWVQGFPR